MDKEKLIELLKDAWNDGMSQYHDCKRHSQYETDLENWLDANEDEINELCVSENTSDESAALHLHVVSGSIIGKQIKHNGILQTITDVHESGEWVMTDKSKPNGVKLKWDSVELLF